MTVEEKLEAINDYCDLDVDCSNHVNGKPCVLRDVYLCPDQLLTDKDIETAYNLIHDNTHDAETVNHPNHYNSGMECIDEMLLIFGVEATMHFCLLNCWKYRYRAVDKNGAEDIKKSHWYMAKYKELKEQWDKRIKELAKCHGTIKNL